MKATSTCSKFILTCLGFVNAPLASITHIVGSISIGTKNDSCKIEVSGLLEFGKNNSAQPVYLLPSSTSLSPLISNVKCVCLPSILKER